MRKDVTLFDLWMRTAQSDGVQPSVIANAQKAKRFVFDDAASKFMGELLRKAPLEILHQHRFAKPSYAITWVEMNHDVYYRLGLHLKNASGPEVDGFFGIYVYYDRVIVVTSDIEGKSVTTSPIYFDLHNSVSFEQELTTAEIFGIDRITLRKALLGLIGDIHLGWWSSQEAVEICRSHRLRIMPEIAKASKDRLAHLLISGAGTLKLILTMLLLLARPHSTFNVQEVGHRRSILKGKPVVLKEHHVLKLRLEHKDPVTRYLSHQSPGPHRKLHDVRGHWAQNRKKAVGCSHDWIQLDPTHFQCVVCGTNRWWKTDHQRGKKDLGQVTKEYDVTR